MPRGKSPFSYGEIVLKGEKVWFSWGGGVGGSINSVSFGHEKDLKQRGRRTIHRKKRRGVIFLYPEEECLLCLRGVLEEKTSATIIKENKLRKGARCVIGHEEREGGCILPRDVYSFTSGGGGESGFFSFLSKWGGKASIPVRGGTFV